MSDRTAYFADYYLRNREAKNVAARSNYKANRDRYREQARAHDALPENRIVKITAKQFAVSRATARDWLLFNFVDWKSRKVRTAQRGRPPSD